LLEDTVDRLGLMLLPSVVRHAQTGIRLYAQNPTAVTRTSLALQPLRLLGLVEEATEEMAVVLILTCAVPNGATVAMGALGVIVIVIAIVNSG
jgi:hypothetical protein